MMRFSLCVIFRQTVLLTLGGHASVLHEYQQDDQAKDRLKFNQGSADKKNRNEGLC